MDVYHFKNFEMLDPEAGELRNGHELVVEGDTIREVSSKPIKLIAAKVIDCGESWHDPQIEKSAPC